MTIVRNVIFTCDACNRTVTDVKATVDWWGVGRVKENQFQRDKHICGRCYVRIFEWKVADEVRVQ